jgi:hypothetical protein
MSVRTAAQPSGHSPLTSDQHDQFLARRMAERSLRVTSKEPKLMSSFYSEQEGPGATTPSSL